MDGVPNTGSSGATPLHPAAWQDEFKRLVAEVEATASDWGVRPDSREGKFVAALLGTTAWLGRLGVASQESLQALSRENREAAEVELARAREVTKAANAALGQARSALINLQVERENVVIRMIQETLPLFIKELRGALVLREKAWNDGVKRRRFFIAGAATLGVFLSGYALCAWSDSGAVGALDRCLAHTLQAGDKIFCDVTTFANNPP